MLSTLPEIIHVVNDRARVWTQADWLLSSSFQPLWDAVSLKYRNFSVYENIVDIISLKGT